MSNLKMITTKKFLNKSLFNNVKFGLGLSAILFSVTPEAFSATQEAQENKPSAEVDCSETQCKTQEGLLFRVRSEGEENPLANGEDTDSLQQNRRVDVEYQDLYTYDEQGFTPDQKKATVQANLTIQLENGGLLWATEDPALTPPVLGINTGGLVAISDGQISEDVNISYYTNYAAFVSKLELSVYQQTDSDLVSPLVTKSLPISNNGRYVWDGKLTLDQELIAGQELLYVLRAYDKDGNMDETKVKSLRLVTPEEKKSNLQKLVESVLPTGGEQLSDEELANQFVESNTFGSNNLAKQNIPIYGSRVRVFGQDVPENKTVAINGHNIPVDQERKFVAEYLLPVGQHSFDVALGRGEEQINKQLAIDVTGEYMFMVALADLTASKHSVSDSIQAVDEADNFDDDLLLEGRLAFYLKGKIKGKYLITAQADTQERELGDLFEGFLDKDPKDVFRRLDPDRYYPVYGDDSTVYRDVDTQGRFYVRVDWDKNQALWGNFNTGITGNEFAQYARSLYGAALSWRSTEATELGDAKSTLKVFASQAQTALGHVEFLGTGGSLYYLRDTDILPGSDKVVLEIRDHTTGRVDATVNLLRGVDYEIDELQGRIILTRPLAQISRQNLNTIIRDQPVDGFDNILLVDYEYLPSGFNADETTVGARGKFWLGEHLSIGGTFVDENRAGDDYQLSGLDVILQAGRGTYLKVESAQTESDQAASFFSDNGGFSFRQIAADPTLISNNKKGDAYSIEARANFKELGYTENESSAAVWYRNTDADYSIARRTLNEESTETGAEYKAQFGDELSLYARASNYERGSDNELQQVQVNLGYQVTEKALLSAELKQLEETISGVSTSATLAAIKYNHRFGEVLDLYGIGQFTLDNDGGQYENNDLVTLGTRYLFAERSSLGAEYTTGHRGDAYSLTGDYQVSPEQNIYGRYTYSTDTTDSVFGPSINDGITLGQRWRLSNQVTIYNESQQLKTAQETGLVHTFGMDFMPAKGWNLGLSLQQGELEALSGTVDRQGATLSGGYRSPNSQWSSKLEYRRDTGAEARKQWLTANRWSYKIDEDWRLAARINYSDTDDALNPDQDARFTEANLGFAYRPIHNDRWAFLGKYTYLYDLRTAAQVTTGSDQKSNIFAFEGIFRLNHDWEFAGKYAHRKGQIRAERGTGSWFKSTADLYVLQSRYHLIKEWDALVEYRILEVKENQDKRTGWLVGADYHISENFKVGLGYNLTDFSDNLANLDYRYDGWFLNFVGKY